MNTTKTCPHCLGQGKIIVNAGTGLTADCVKCDNPKPSDTITKVSSLNNTITELSPSYHLVIGSKC